MSSHRTSEEATSFGDEDAFIHSDRRYRTIIEQSTDITMLVDAAGKVTYVSPSITSILGYTSEEIVGSQALTLVHPNDVESIQQGLEGLNHTSGKSFRAEYRLRTKDGSHRWFEGSETNLLQVPGVRAIIRNFRDITERKLAPPSNWSEIGQFEHFVQFYESDAFLLESLCGFVMTGLDLGETCVIVATQAHQEGLAKRLKTKGLDLPTAQARGEYISLDVVETLSKFMVDGSPDAERFAEVVGNVIVQAARGLRHVRVFGEMVSLLWTEGNESAAIHLEELWNDLYHKTHPFSLLCAYSMQDFAGEGYGARFTEVCGQHSRVIPDESYTALTTPDERLRAISLLQQKANSLEAGVAERKGAEERFRISEARLRFMAESMPQKIFTAKPNGNIDYFNPQWTEFTGLSFEQIRDWGWIQFIHPDDVEETVRLWQLSLTSGEPYYFEHRFRRVDGVYRWHISRAIPMRDAAGNITMWIGSNTDIDEQKQLEARKDEFISMASHELITPVTSLKGFTHLLQRRLLLVGDVQTQLYLKRMDVQLTKLTNLISNLLDLSKIQVGKFAYQIELVDLDALVYDTVEQLQAITPTPHLQRVGRTNAQITGDRDRLEQVFINLLSNAVKYSPGADTILITLSKDGEQAVLISIQDFGIGISEAHHERIFERFYQVPDPLEKTFPGLGIGLYLSRQIIQRHNGRLWVESHKGKGSTFYISLPVHQDSLNVPAAQEGEGQ